MELLNIDIDERLKRLRTINHFNFDGPFLFNKERDTDFVISKSAQNILAKYRNKMKRKATIIIKYDNDLYSFLAYRMIRCAASAAQIEINLRVLGEIKTEQEKEIFKNFKTISWRKAKKLKNAIFVTGYHPIYNVLDLSFYSKIFIEILNPIEKFPPDSLTVAQSFYLDPDSSLWSTFIETRKDNYLDCDWSEKIDKNIPICIFELKGNEEDFPVFNFILKSSKEGNIHLYLYDNEKQANFILTNLRPYLDIRNIPAPINIITLDEYKILFTKALDSKNNIINDINYFSINNLPEEETINENSYC